MKRTLVRASLAVATASPVSARTPATKREDVSAEIRAAPTATAKGEGSTRSGSNGDVRPSNRPRLALPAPDRAGTA